MWRAFIILYAAYILAKKNERLEKHACGSAAGRLLSWDSTPGSRHWFLFTCLCHHLHQCHTMPSNLIPEPLTPPSSMKRRREREWGRQTSTCRAFAAFGTFLICFTPERKFWKVSVTFPNLQRRKLITEKFKVTVLKERQLCGSKFHVLYTVHGLPLWLSWWRTCLHSAGSIPATGKIPWRREQLPTPVFWPGEFHGLYSPWGRKESDMTE